MKNIVKVIFAMLIMSCNGRREHIEYYPRGEVRLKGIVESGKRTGVWEKYNVEGKLTEKLYYNNDSLFKKENFVDGHKVISKEIRNGKEHGIVRTFFESGKVSSETSYYNGKQVGEGIEYYSNGNVKIEYSMGEDGEVTGEFKQYYPNGQVNVEAPIIGNSVYKMFDSTGVLLLEIENKDFFPVYTSFYQEGAMEKLTEHMKPMGLPSSKTPG